jgi:hypothetical protein
MQISSAKITAIICVSELVSDTYFFWMEEFETAGI